MFKNILVPFDAGFIPKKSLMTAATLASEGASITLLHVIDVASDIAPEISIPAIVDDAIERYEFRIQGVIGNALAILSEYGATASAAVVRGRPVHDVINRVAKDINADLILMGSHGRSGLSRILRGSVTEEVMRRARVPVLTIRESPATSVPMITSEWTAPPLA